MLFLKQIAAWLGQRRFTQSAPSVMPEPALQAAAGEPAPAPSRPKAYSDFIELFGRAVMVNAVVSAIRIDGIGDEPRSLAFRGVRVWKRDAEGGVRLYKDEIEARASSVKVARKTAAVGYCPRFVREVSYHSEKELNPFWELSFPEPVDVSHLEFWGRLGAYGRNSYPLAFSVKGEDGHWRRVKRWDGQQDYMTENFAVLEDLAAPLEERVPGIRALVADLGETLAGETPKTFGEDAPMIRRIAACCAALNEGPLPEVGNWPKSAATAKLPPDAGLSPVKVRITTYGQVPFELGVVLCKGRDADGNPAEHRYPSVGIRQPCIERDELVAVLDAGYQQMPRQTVITLPEGFHLEEFKFWGLPDRMQGATTLHDIHVAGEGGEWVWIGGTVRLFRMQQQLYRFWAWLAKGETREFQLSFATYMTRHRRRFIDGFIRHRNKDRDRLRELLDEIRRVGDSFKHSRRIMYTKHGLGVSLATRDAADMLQKMVSFQAAMNAIPGVSVFPCYGTLLGFHRDKGFIPHDDDIDWGCVVPLADGEDMIEVRNAWYDRIVAAGMKVKPMAPRSLNMHIVHDGETMDLFLMFCKGAETMAHMEKFQIRPVATDLLLPLQETEFLGHKFLAPNRIEGFLKDRYGDGWVVSDPTYGI